MRQLQFLRLGELDIAASCTAVAVTQDTLFHPSTYLCYVAEGSLTVRTATEQVSARAGELFLVRKYTECDYTKVPDPHTGRMISYAFGLTDLYLARIIEQVRLSPKLDAPTARLLPVANSAPLQNVMDWVRDRLVQPSRIDSADAELLTLEALRGIVQIDETVAMAFAEFARPERVDLMQFMATAWQLDTSLERIAHQAGRSLSSFKREFGELFDMTPKRWIQQKRLVAARQMLQAGASVSEAGAATYFRDLAHFSRSFKAAFGVLPSRILAGAGV